MKKEINRFIEQIQDSKTHYSTLILEYLKPWNTRDKWTWETDEDYEISLLKSLKNYADLTKTMIDDLGWIEHTSDWDLNILVAMKDGTIHGTGHGYGSFGDFNFDRKTVAFDFEDEENEGHKTRSFPILQIQSITLIR